LHVSSYWINRLVFNGWTGSGIYNFHIEYRCRDSLFNSVDINVAFYNGRRSNSSSHERLSIESDKVSRSESAQTTCHSTTPIWKVKSQIWEDFRSPSVGLWVVWNSRCCPAESLTSTLPSWQGRSFCLLLTADSWINQCNWALGWDEIDWNGWSWTGESHVQDMDLLSFCWSVGRNWRYHLFSWLCSSNKKWITLSCR